MNDQLYSPADVELAAQAFCDGLPPPPSLMQRFGVDLPEGFSQEVADRATQIFALRLREQSATEY